MIDYFPPARREPDISSIDDWLGLPAPQFPRLKQSDDTGTVFRVKSVACVVVSAEECAENGIDAIQVAQGKSILPAFKVKFGGEYLWCRLPTDLSPWVVSSLAQTKAKVARQSFPLNIEFGVCGGKTVIKYC